MKSQDLPVRFSNLKKFAKSPAHYLSSLSVPFEPTAAMQLGTTVHNLVLQPDRLEVHGKDKRSKEYWSAIDRLGPDIQVFTELQIKDAQPIAASVLSNASAMLALSGIKEQRIDWQIGPRLCRSTPDAYNVESNQVGDLKVSFTSEPEQFVRHAEQMYYHAQLAFYRRATAMPTAQCRLVVVEKDPPYPVTVINLSESILKKGDDLCRQWFERLVQCEASGEFPGYVTQPYEWE